MKGGLGNLMRQAQQMQENMKKAQAELADLEVTGESGAGMVKVTLNGHTRRRRCRSSRNCSARTRTCSKIYWRPRSTMRCGKSPRALRRSTPVSCPG